MASMVLPTWSVDAATSILIFGRKVTAHSARRQNFGVALLTPVPLNLRDGHSVHADPGQCVADLVKLEWLDDGHDDFHGCNPPSRPGPAGAGSGRLHRSFTRAESQSRSNVGPEESNRVPSPKAGHKWQEMKSFLNGPRALGRVSVRSSRKKSDHACIIFYLGAKILASWRFVTCNCWSRLKTAMDWKARLSRGR